MSALEQRESDNEVLRLADGSEIEVRMTTRNGKVRYALTLCINDTESYGEAELDVLN